MRRGLGRVAAPVCASSSLGLLVAGCCLALALPAEATGMRRLDGAWLLPAALHEVLLESPGAPPAAAGFWLRAAHARLFGLPELPARLLAAGAAGRGWAAEIGWEALGGQALRDDRLTARGTVGRGWRLGLWVGRRSLRPGPGPAGGGLAVDLELMTEGRRPWLGAWSVATQWPLLRDADDWLPAEPETRLRAALAAPGRALALRLDVAADGRPVFGWEALAGLGGSLGVAWRADRASGAMGGGLIWRSARLRLRTSHLAHPDLGLTHRIEIGVGRPGASPW